MPRRRFIDKKNATTFALVHRAQNDPLIHDADAPSMVFTEITGPNTQSTQPHKASRPVKDRGDLEDEFGMSFRKNEGQAAEQGVFYDDTKYDYMQHMRELGTGGGAATWVEAKQEKKGKGKMRLEDALREVQLDDGVSEGGVSLASSRSLLPDELLPSEFVRKTTYQDMQDTPDAIKGFQPDMDPRLREVLEALDDEAYVDEDEDIFDALAAEGEEVDKDEWEDTFFDEEDGAGGDYYDDDGWESDATIKPDNEADASTSPPSLSTLSLDQNGDLPPPTDTTAAPPSDPTNGAWLDEFAKFKNAVKNASAPTPRIQPSNISFNESVQTGLSSIAGRKKKRKGAMTNGSSYSMTSSALARTDAQTLLDQRFDKIEEEYADDGVYGDESQFGDDTASMVSGMTGMTGMSRASAISTYSRATDSEAPQLVRRDFDGIMDDFLGGHSKVGKRGRHVKKSGFQTGMQQLDEVRGGLGPVRWRNEDARKKAGFSLVGQ